VTPETLYLITLKETGKISLIGNGSIHKEWVTTTTTTTQGSNSKENGYTTNHYSTAALTLKTVASSSSISICAPAHYK